jgi:hypothetical protein
MPTVFKSQAFAGIRQRDVLPGPHRYGYEHLPVTPKRAGEARIETFLEPPASPTRLDISVSTPVWSLFDETKAGADRMGFFRWGKAVDAASPSSSRNISKEEATLASSAASARKSAGIP